MNYFSAKKSLELLESFRNDVLVLWEIENAAKERFGSYSWMADSDVQTTTQREASKDARYQPAREQVARKIQAVSELASKFGIPYIYTSYPPPAFGGYAISVNCFQAILHDPSHRKIDQQLIYDTLIQTIAACEMYANRKRQNILNPLCWVKACVVFILRLPYNIITLSGFNPEKFDQQLWGTALKFTGIALFIAILLYLGINIQEVARLLLDKYFNIKLPIS